MSFPAYPAYKYSGVEWLGEVPQHWPVYSLKRTVEGCVNGLWGDEPDGENDIAVIRVADFERSFATVGLDKLTYRSITTKEKQSRLIKSGDLLIEKSGGGEKTLVGCVVLFKHEFEAITSNFVARMRPLSEFDSNFLCYAFGSLYHGRVNYPSVKQVTGIQNLDAESYLQERFCFPALPEQIQIARFLDHETARIDVLIEEQQRMIELLKEKRQAVISHAVTKGLDPTLPMKESGVEWLGEIPVHWKTNALNKLTVKITNGYVGPTRDILVESGVPYVQATHIKKGVVNFDDAYFVTPEWSMKMRKSILQEYDVLIVQTGAGTGDVGVVSSRESGYNCHALIILQSDKSMLSGTYLGQVLQSCFGQSVLFSIRTGGMHPHLNCGEVKFVKIPVPPLKEQEEISNFVMAFSEQAEKLIIEAGATMDLLQERRSALISAAVTGKIDVRGWQSPASAPLTELAVEVV
ncbi:restriction endonuclease subunit S [Pseudomonas chlororaphis]|uniref:Type I restriction-modification system, specificity subunit S n=1 Tax=Pseudomonas chlororaphis subsp. aureofaciens TaxID=587851 RepID=A0AAD0ZFF3_9PSED|nr:restriction endonuclease subunit S [Pseudomonas chlororaphis]AZE30307.1 Type I restriction-modification system, specificity subunit S [Pseudomonas chlororaphis subsp. aureofaciens]